MFQTFDATTTPEQGPPRLSALRAEIAREGLDGFLVPRADAHQGEYVAPRDERLAWLTGFTGSAGFAVILADIAGVFIDGRYRVQVRAQVAADFTPVHWPETKAAPWIIEHLQPGAKVGFDPWLHTVDEVETLRNALEAQSITLVPVANLIDRIWPDQPGPPMGKVAPHALELAGESHDDKRARLAEALRKAGHKGALITLPDSLAWLLNIRGSDIPRNPVPHGFAVLNDDASVDLFMAEAKLEGCRAHLGDAVRVHPPLDILDHLEEATGPIRVDRDTAPVKLAQAMKDADVEVAYARDPCVLPKARKNATEIAGTTEAHLRDAAAMCEFLAWLDRQPPGTLTEIDVARTLEGYRRATNALRDISFDTISGAGPNGAIVHYRVTEGTNARVEDGQLLLIDSGGQYLDGTTDITRTIAVGDVPEDPKVCFTRVLQGMIAISKARWPKGLAGRDLDALARIALWEAGQDYDHGTGHGVGTYLCVHEGPQRLARISTVPLEVGMILSNEPGYYREGAFGIRIENLIVVDDAPALPGGDPHREMLCFRTLTWVPIDRRLVVPEQLTEAERAWLNRYHADVAEKITPRLSDEAQAWLASATAPL